jgi:catechol 2,3-dioxygenase-like lactoylglutathione lyase family enzyme
MLDHLGFAVANLQRSRAFYLAALAPLGMAIHSEDADGIIFSLRGRPLLCLDAPHVRGAPGSRIHFAFEAPDHAAVDGFHAAAIAAGGLNNGTPGLRPQYHANYYAAFILDPDGHNIEAVCHAPGAAEDQT